MGFNIALVVVLAVVFAILLIIVVYLALHLARKKRAKCKNALHLTENEPFLRPEKKFSFDARKRRLSEFMMTSPVEDDEVFDEGDCTLSDISFSLFHMAGEEKLVIDIGSVESTPDHFTRGYLEAQLFPPSFAFGEFRTSERACVANTVVFDENFVIPNIRVEALAQAHLKLFLYACNGYIGTENAQCVGHAVFPLHQVQFSSKEKTHLKKKLIQHRIRESLRTITTTPTDDDTSLSSTPSPTRDKGELYISLRYQKKSGRINVVVLKAENIQKGSVLQNDPYVKIKLLYEGEVVDKKQTKSKRRASMTCWNEPFAFNIEEDRGIHNYELLFLVRRRDLISPNASIGHVRVGPQVGGAGQSHWYAMMAKGNLMRQVARYHKIK